ncbi:hypothetical protein, partial [Actinoalloteichus spitiensis]|uniref:hypothetical protein n=1 Tax=Actinoalloteichus spitiensis TaxID=252394 RepID=UPI000474D392
MVGTIRAWTSSSDRCLPSPPGSAGAGHPVRRWRSWGSGRAEGHTAPGGSVLGGVPGRYGPDNGVGRPTEDVG